MGRKNTIGAARQTALDALKCKITEHYGPECNIFLFGSAARGDDGVYSDIDVLVLLPVKVDAAREEHIFDLAFEVGLEYDMVFGVIVYSKNYWETPRARVMPLYQNIRREGIRL